jgi:hypothetical protein
LFLLGPQDVKVLQLQDGEASKSRKLSSPNKSQQVARSFRLPRNGRPRRKNVSLAGIFLLAGVHSLSDIELSFLSHWVFTRDPYPPMMPISALVSVLSLVGRCKPPYPPVSSIALGSFVSFQLDEVDLVETVSFDCLAQPPLHPPPSLAANRDPPNCEYSEPDCF